MKNLMKNLIFWKIRMEAKIVLRKYKPKIVAVTGSVGKTSTKDAIDTAMSTALYTRKSQKSYNSEIGTPLTIIGRDSGWNSLWQWTLNIIEGFLLIILRNHYPKWLILEFGIDRPGDMQRMIKWIKPDIAVFTRFSKVPVHVEFFSSPEEVIQEKTKLAEALKEDGILILNYDDKDVLKIKNKVERKSVTYGLEEGAGIKGSNEEIIYERGKPRGITFRIDLDGKSLPVNLKGVLGKQHIYPILASVAVGKALALNLVDIVRAFGKYTAAPGRMRILEGIRGSTIIDDSYNSSPVALNEALNVLEKIKNGGEKIAVLGDMMEIGKFTAEEHKKAGVRVAKIAQVLVTIGPRAKYIAEGARDAGMEDIVELITSEEAGEYLKDKIEENDVVLVKGSQSIRTEKIVAKIMARPENREKLLVRQEKEWEER
jgi:UDP-N-acetylmuramoyl-tripeptide--D-alanyl-D-alanine ligase